MLFLLKRASTTSLLVCLFLDLLFLRIPLVLDFLLSFLSFFDICLPLCSLVFCILFVHMREALHHGVDRLLLLIHECLLEWTLCREVQSLEKVGLATFIDLRHVVENGDPLLLLKGEVRLDCFRDVEPSKDAFFSFTI